MPLLTTMTRPALRLPPSVAPGRPTSLPPARGDVRAFLPGHPHTGVATVAHRGASAHAPENTIAAVVEAVEQGADTVEVDVHRSKDGALVVLHDASLSRTTDAQRRFPHRGSWKVDDLTLDEIRRLDAGSWKSDRYAGEPVPTLAEVVAAARAGGVGLLVEVKHPQRYPGIEADLAIQLAAMPGYVDEAVAAGRLVVQSFDHASMRAFKAFDPRIPVGALGAPPRRRLREIATWADQVNPRHRAVGPGYVSAVQRAGMRCQVWTVDGVADMSRAIAMGVDGIITNRPQALRQLLRDRSAAAAS